MLAIIKVALVMVSFYSNKTQTKTDTGNRDRGIAVIGLTIVLFGVMWIFLDWTWKAENSLNGT